MKLFCWLVIMVSASPLLWGGAFSVERERWESCSVRPDCIPEVRAKIELFERTRSRYESVSFAKDHGVPAIVIFCLHMRESDNDFSCHLHEGSSLLHRTRYVPKGRVPAPLEPPFKWETSAFDAIYVCDKLDGVDWGDMGAVLWTIEKYNGAGYWNRGKVSPYVFAKTNLYFRGKFTSDGRYDPMAIDSQIGCAAILKMYVSIHGHL